MKLCSNTPSSFTDWERAREPAAPFADTALSQPAKPPRPSRHNAHANARHAVLRNVRSVPEVAPPAASPAAAGEVADRRDVQHNHDEGLPAAQPKPPRYVTKKREPVEFNGAVRFEGRDERIECRHLALAWLKQIIAGGKPDYGILGDKGNIARGVPFAIQGEFKKLLANAREVHIVANDAWGGFSMQQFTKMESTGVSAKRMLVLSGNHAMAAEYKIKELNGQKKYVLKVYDPNRTNTHMRAWSTSPLSDSAGTMATHSLLDLLPLQQCHDRYFGKSGRLRSETVAVAFALPGDYQEAMAPLTAQERAARCPATMPDHTDASVLHHLIAFGFAGSDIAERLAEKIVQYPWMEASLLAAMQSEGTPGLFKALQDDHAETVKVFTDLVMASTTLLREQVADLFAARLANGTPGLFMALQDGFVDTVKAFADAVLASRLEPDQKATLLAAENAGTPGLHMALQYGHAETVKVFAAAVLASPTLGPGQQAALLAAEDDAGTPGLYMALQGGHAETVKVFTDLVITSALAPDRMVDLFAARSNNKTPGLFMALQNGFADTVKAFADAVLASKLEPDQKAALLAALDERKIPGLYGALQDGLVDTVKAFADAVLASRDLNPNQKAALLAALDEKTKIPGLYAALQDGHADTVKAFADVVLASNNMRQAQKVRLLAAENKEKLPGLYVALQDGHTDTVKAFAGAVLASRALTPAQKARLLAAEGANNIPGLFRAWHNGHADTVGVFVGAVLASGLAEDQKMRLLSMRLPGGGTMDLDGGGAAARAYRDAVNNSTAHDDTKTALLASIPDPDRP